MGLAILHCRAQYGTDAPPVTIEVFLSGGLPSFAIVGMAETAVRESKDRVRGALVSSGFEWPQSRITVSLGPAEMRKMGGRYDLAIALGILAARRFFPPGALDGVEFYGELALSGELRPVPGLLPSVIKAHAAGRRVVVPGQNAAEAALAGAAVIAASSLDDVVAHLSGRKPIALTEPADVAGVQEGVPDLADVRGQKHAKRALEIAAAGNHNLLFIGPPGTGKSMLARRLPGLLPRMSEAEALQTAAVNSVAGIDIEACDWRRRPFRAPHHTASAPALVGGGPTLRPGEISRAHNGVLFLDELPEFNRNVLEVLREPLEAGAITIARAGMQADFPARFQLVAAMNPCPCGYLGDPLSDCRCSGDRIDLHVEVLRPSTDALREPDPDGEDSRSVAARVARAWQVQMARSGTANSRLAGAAFEEACRAGDACWTLLENAADRFNLSARAHQRVLKVSRTIADLAGANEIAPPHVAEALSLRCLDRRL